MRWAGYRDEENTWEPRKHLEGTEAMENWEKLSLERREELSRLCLHTCAQAAEPDVAVNEGSQGARPSAEDIARRVMECKLRTVSLGALYWCIADSYNRSRSPSASCR